MAKRAGRVPPLAPPQDDAPLSSSSGPSFKRAHAAAAAAGTLLLAAIALASSSPQSSLAGHGLRWPDAERDAMLAALDRVNAQPLQNDFNGLHYHPGTASPLPLMERLKLEYAVPGHMNHHPQGAAYKPLPTVSDLRRQLSGSEKRRLSEGGGGASAGVLTVVSGGTRTIGTLLLRPLAHPDCQFCQHCIAWSLTSVWILHARAGINGHAEGAQPLRWHGPGYC